MAPKSGVDGAPYSKLVKNKRKKRKEEEQRKDKE
jgi:hypothetical protein